MAPILISTPVFGSSVLEKDKLEFICISIKCFFKIIPGIIL